MADIYFAYGKALLENAIAQNSVLGKEQQEGGTTAEEGTAECYIFWTLPDPWRAC